MSKTNLTKAIELALMKKYYYDGEYDRSSGEGRRFAFECKVFAPKEFEDKHGKHMSYKIGRVDFITIHKKRDEEFISCFEIKISKSDFKSKNGHNLIGDYNYYVIPELLVDYVKEHRPIGIGVISYSEDTGELLTEVNPRKVKDRFMSYSNTLERIKHNMLTACNSTMRRLLSYE